MNFTRKRKIEIFIFTLWLVLLTSWSSDNSRQGVIGRWQDADYPSLETEFTQDGKFNEYFYKELVSYGEYAADGDIISLHYFSPCGGDKPSCDVRLRFTVTENTLILTDSDGDFIFNKVSVTK